MTVDDEATGQVDAVELALMVAESEHGEAGPNVARVLAAEVRRLQIVQTEFVQLSDSFIAESNARVADRAEIDRLSQRVAELERARDTHKEG